MKIRYLMQANLPTQDISYADTVAKIYRSFWENGTRVDFVPGDVDLETLKQYKLVVLPMVHMLSEQEEQVYHDFVAQGGNILISYFSNIADRTLRVKLGGYGGKLVRDLAGVYVEEFYPLREGQGKLSNGYEIELWSELSRAEGAEVIASFEATDVDGSPALTVRDHSGAKVWYQGTELSLDSQKKFLAEVCFQLGVSSEGGGSTEVVKRGPYRFEIDHKANSVSLTS